jgi:anti-sigma factor RsiW
VSASHAGVRDALGAYVLGALEPAERAAVDGHLGACGECRDALAELAALPGLLGRLSPEEVAEGLRPVPEIALEEATSAVSRSQREQGRRLRVWRGLAAALTIVALLLAAPALLREPAPHVRLAPEAVAADAASVEGFAALRERAWGMEVELELQNLPARQGYTLLAVADDGHDTVAATWAATDTGRVSLTGACYLPLEELERMDVVSPEGEVLLTFRG